MDKSIIVQNTDNKIPSIGITCDWTNKITFIVRFICFKFISMRNVLLRENLTLSNLCKEDRKKCVNIIASGQSSVKIRQTIIANINRLVLLVSFV